MVAQLGNLALVVAAVQEDMDYHLHEGPLRQIVVAEGLNVSLSPEHQTSVQHLRDDMCDDLDVSSRLLCSHCGPRKIRHMFVEFTGMNQNHQHRSNHSLTSIRKYGNERQRRENSPVEIPFFVSLLHDSLSKKKASYAKMAFVNLIHR